MLAIQLQEKSKGNTRFKQNSGGSLHISFSQLKKEKKLKWMMVREGSIS